MSSERIASGSLSASQQQIVESLVDGGITQAHASKWAEKLEELAAARSQPAAQHLHGQGFMEQIVRVLRANVDKLPRLTEFLKERAAELAGERELYEKKLAEAKDLTGRTAQPQEQAGQLEKLRRDLQELKGSYMAKLADYNLLLEVQQCMPDIGGRLIDNVPFVDTGSSQLRRREEQQRTKDNWLRFLDCASDRLERDMAMVGDDKGQLTKLGEMKTTVSHIQDLIRNPQHASSQQQQKFIRETLTDMPKQLATLCPGFKEEFQSLCRAPAAQPPHPQQPLQQPQQQAQPQPQPQLQSQPQPKSASIQQTPPPASQDGEPASYASHLQPGFPGTSTLADSSPAPEGQSSPSSGLQVVPPFVDSKRARSAAESARQNGTQQKKRRVANGGGGLVAFTSSMGSLLQGSTSEDAKVRESAAARLALSSAKARPMLTTVRGSMGPASDGNALSVDSFGSLKSDVVSQWHDSSPSLTGGTIAASKNHIPPPFAFASSLSGVDMSWQAAMDEERKLLHREFEGHDLQETTKPVPVDRAAQYALLVTFRMNQYPFCLALGLPHSYPHAAPSFRIVPVTPEDKVRAEELHASFKNSRNGHDMRVHHLVRAYHEFMEQVQRNSPSGPPSTHASNGVAPERTSV